MPPMRFLPLLLMFSVACSSNSASTAPEPNAGDQPRAFIDNRASVDMDIYLLRSGGQSIRLGFLAGGENTTFPLPTTVTAGSTSITFEARPVRRSGRTVRSEPFHLGAEEIKWSIPPQ